MEPMEQMMIQIWLGQLLASLKEGKVDHVMSELETALARIEEDQAPTPDTPPVKG